MPDRLVQEDARPSRPQHHDHRSGGRFASMQVEQRLIDCLRCVILKPLFVEETVIEAAPATDHPLLPPAILFDDDVEGKPYQWAHIGSDDAIAAGDENCFEFSG